MATAPPPSKLVASKVETKNVVIAVDALLKWIENKSKKEKPQLLAQDEFIYLTLSLKKIPSKGRVNAYKIPLPTPLYGAESELCLIIDDRSKSNLTKEDAQKKVKSDEIIGVSKLLKVSKLRTDYRPHEAKRKLCDSYDLFLADNRVIPVMPKLLGKHFFKKRKIPVPVDLRHKDWKGQIERACSSALLYLRTGTCCTLRVARGSMERDEIVGNVVAAIDGAVEIIPKKWGNVRSLHLKFSESVALPIYEAYPDAVLKISGIEEEKAKSAEKLGKVSKKANDGENEAKEGKSGSKKGRISEVRYMDNMVDDVLLESGELVSDTGDDLDVSEEEKPHIEENSIAGTENKKRKKRDSTTKQDAVSESKGKKGSKRVAVEVNEGGLKLKKDGLSSKAVKESAGKSKRVAIEIKGEGAKPKKDGLSVKAVEMSNGKSKKAAVEVKGDGAKRKNDVLSAKAEEELDGKSKKVKKELGKVKNSEVEIKGKKKKPVAAWK